MVFHYLSFPETVQVTLNVSRDQHDFTEAQRETVGRLMELQLQREAEAEADSLARSGVHACSVSSSRPHTITDEKERRPLRSAACFILSLYSKFNSIGGTHIPQQKVGSIPNRLPSSVKHNFPPKNSD